MNFDPRKKPRHLVLVLGDQLDPQSSAFFTMNLRKQARAIFKAAVQAADPVEAVLRHFELRDGSLRVAGRRYRLAQFDHGTGTDEQQDVLALALIRPVGLTGQRRRTRRRAPSRTRRAGQSDQLGCYARTGAADRSDRCVGLSG